MGDMNSDEDKWFAFNYWPQRMVGIPSRWISVEERAVDGLLMWLGILNGERWRVKNGVLEANGSYWKQESYELWKKHISPEIMEGSRGGE